MTDRREQLMKMRDADPTDADIPYMLAQESIRTDDGAAAVEWFDACLALDPNYHYAYYHKAKALESLERSDEAVDVLTAGMTIARADGATQAINEIGAYLDELT